MDTPEARRQRASKLGHELGGIDKTADALTSPPAAPRDTITLSTLLNKYPTEDSMVIDANGKAQAEQHVGTTEVHEEVQSDRD